jgi:hypothetical protein
MLNAIAQKLPVLYSTRGQHTQAYTPANGDTNVIAGETSADCLTVPAGQR